jgi:sodium/potassium-transporting ATPase subunit alpha
LKFAQLNFCDVKDYRPAKKKVCEVPYNSTNRYQVSIHETNDSDNRYLLVMKGAPESILERCSHIYIDGADLELNDYWKNQFNDAYMKLGGFG